MRNCVRKCRRINLLNRINGGEGGIRTPGTVTRTPHFECGAIDQLCHLSATRALYADAGGAIAAGGLLDKCTGLA